MSSEGNKQSVKSENLLNGKSDNKATEPSPSLLKSDESSAALLPADVLPNDIVFGRGRGYHAHHGNERMREIIDRYKMRYHALDKSQKRELVGVVYEEIVGDGARFLVKASSGGGYVEADRKMSIQKVSNALRCKKSFQREAAAAAAAASSPKRKGAILPAAENHSYASTLALRPLHEGLSSAIPGASGLIPQESLRILTNNPSNNNVYSSSLVPWNLGGQSLRGDCLPPLAATGGRALPLSTALWSDLAVTRDPAAAHRNLALGIANQSLPLPYSTIAGGQSSLDPVSLLRQQLLLQQLGVASLGSPRLAVGSTANDLSNRRIMMEELLSPSRAMQSNSVGDKITKNKSSQHKDSEL